MKKKFSYDSGTATCNIFYKGLIFSGSAICHPNDEDMESERTGLSIAEMRADIAYLKYIIKNKLKPQVDILKYLSGCVQSSSRCNRKSYEFKMIQRQLHYLQNKLTATRQELQDTQKYLNYYIKEKEKLYIKIRARRAENNAKDKNQ